MIEKGHFEKGAWIPDRIPPAPPTEIERLWGAIKDLQGRSQVHVDVHMLTPSQVIVVGNLRGHDYVRAYPVANESLPHLIETIEHLEPGARHGRIDEPHPGYFSAAWPERFQ